MNAAAYAPVSGQFVRAASVRPPEVESKCRPEKDCGSTGKEQTNMVRPERFELPTCCSGGNRSIQLSYGRTGIYSLHASRKGQQSGSRIQDSVVGE